MHILTGNYSAEIILHSSWYSVSYGILAVQALLNLMGVMRQNLNTVFSNVAIIIFLLLLFAYICLYSHAAAQAF